MIRMLAAWFEDAEAARKRRFLGGISLFKGMAGPEIARVQQCLSERLYRKGEAIFQEGDVGRALVIVESGSIDILKTLPDGLRRQLNRVGPGEFIGEMALLEEARRSASAVAAEDSNVFLLHKNKLEGLMAECPAVGMAIMGEFARSLLARFRRLEARMLAESPPVESGTVSSSKRAAERGAGPAGSNGVEAMERALAAMAVELDRARRLLAERGLGLADAP